MRPPKHQDSIPGSFQTVWAMPESALASSNSDALAHSVTAPPTAPLKGTFDVAWAMAESMPAAIAGPSHNPSAISFADPFHSPFDPALAGLSKGTTPSPRYESVSDGESDGSPPPKRLKGDSLEGRKEKGKGDIPRAAARAPRMKMTPEEYMILLRLCLRSADTWREESAVAFWKNVTADWQAETGRKHSGLRRVMRTAITARRKYLLELGTGQQDGRTDKEVYEDSWIAVLDEEGRLVRERKERRGAAQAKSDAGLLARAALLGAMKEKKELDPPLPQARSYAPAQLAQRLVGVEEDDPVVIHDDGLEHNALSPSPGSPSPSSGSSTAQRRRGSLFTRGRSRSRGWAFTTTSDDDEVDADDAAKAQRDDKIVDMLAALTKAAVTTAEATAAAAAAAVASGGGRGGKGIAPDVEAVAEAVEERMGGRIEERMAAQEVRMAAQIADLRREQLAILSLLKQAVGGGGFAGGKWEGGSSDVPR